MSGWIVIWGLIITICLSLIVWIFTPKGNDRTVWRSSIVIGLACFYLMWAITYLAQLHPLIVPIRSDLRPEFAE